MERSSSYCGGHSEIDSGSKCPNSSMEEYTETVEPVLTMEWVMITGSTDNTASLMKVSLQIQGQGQGFHIGYDRGTRNSATHSHRMYDTHTSSTSYSQDEVRRGGDIGATSYSSYAREYPTRDYASTD